jgi:hypothetical protein
MSPDPWTGFLDWLTTVLVPSWGELIALMPYVVVGTIVGPMLSIIVLMWAWHMLKRRRGHVKRTEAQPVAALIGDDGVAAFPPNAPYCEEHALVYPATATQCHIDRADLNVACPVDGSVRVASIELCTACGTRYKLGTGSSPLVVTSADGPPEGGAAIA